MQLAKQEATPRKKAGKLAEAPVDLQKVGSESGLGSGMRP